MNFSALENSDLEEKQKYSNLFSRFYDNSRILVILISSIVITAIAIFVWFKSADYQVLYDHLSSERQLEVVNQLNQMHVPYQIITESDQLLVPADQINKLRLYFSKKNFFNSDHVGFELLDKEKFGISQFNEKINYQRALEGELARTVQKIQAINSAQIHIALPESSLFLQDKKEPSASVILNVKSDQSLKSNQINAILHFIASSISDLSPKNITIVDQFGRLLNNSLLEHVELNDSQFRYASEIEEHYKQRIQHILEPLVGIGNVYSQVTAQIDFNVQDSTEEQYEPNSTKNNQSIRSHQMSIHDKINNNNDIRYNVSGSLSNSSYDDTHAINQNQNQKMTKKDMSIKNKNNINNVSTDPKSDINHENMVNYELNHIISHKKHNVGEITRLSAAVVINVYKNDHGELITLSMNQLHNIERLVREAIGYSKIRGDSLYVVNSSFAHNHSDDKILLHDSKLFRWSNIIFFIAFVCFIILMIIFLLRKYIFSSSKHVDEDIEAINDSCTEYPKNKSDFVSENFHQDLNIDQLIHQIGNISNQNPRTIALIIRQWMSNKI